MYCWSANELGAKFIAQIVQSFRNSQPFLAIFSFVVFSGGILGGTLGGICFHTLLKEETRTRILRMTPPRPGMFCFVQYLTGMCIQGASLRRWLVPPATLAHKQELTKVRTKRTENSTILQTDDLEMPRASCSWITIQTPHVCTKYIERTERKSNVASY